MPGRRRPVPGERVGDALPVCRRVREQDAVGLGLAQPEMHALLLQKIRVKGQG